MTEIDVIVLDLDGGDMLQECVDALVAQTVPTRVLVFDNGSEVPVSSRLRPHDQVEVLRSTTNLGFTGGVNDAYHRVVSSYVALVNNDVVVEPDWLATLTGALDDDEHLAAVQSIIRRDRRTIDGAGISIEDGTIRQIGHGQRIGTQLGEAWGVSATATLYRTAALGRSVFDPRFFAYYEDVELCARLHAAGWRTAVLPVIKATHSGSQTAPRLGAAGRRLRTRNRYFVARMHPGVGRVGALVWEDVKGALFGRVSLRGLVEGLVEKV